MTASFAPVAPRPLAWLHVPKTGTSFGVALLHYMLPELPSSKIPKDGDAYFNPSSSVQRQLRLRYNGSLWAKKSGLGDHTSISRDAYARHRGSFVGFFREPLTRAASAMAHYSAHFRSLPANMSFAAYEKQVRNSAALMLAGGTRNGHDCHATLRGCKPDIDDATRRLALERLDGFAFVGLVEHWALSICLFHRLLRGGCILDFEFGNIRNQGGGEHAGATEGLGTQRKGRDDADDEVYAAATRRFWADVARTGLSKAACANDRVTQACA